MADVISGDTSIADLLSEQKTTSQHLELFKDTNEYTQDLLLEQMQTNEELSSFNKNMQQFSNVIMIGMKNISSKIAEFRDVEQPEIIIGKDLIPVATGTPNATPITFEGGELVPVVQTASEFLGKSLKNDAIMINKLGAMVDYQQGLLKMAEAAEDVGTVDVPTGGSPTDKDDDTSSGSIGGLFGGLGKKLSKKFPVLGKLGKGALKAAKFLGPIAAAGIALFEFGKGVENAAEIVGRPMESLSTLEKAGAGLAGVVEGLTFGLVDAKTAYGAIETMADTVASISSDIFNMMPASVQKGLTGISDYLFNSETGLFGFARQTFTGVIDSLSQGNWGDALLQLFVGSIGGIIGPEGFIMRSLNNTWELVKSGVGMLFDMLPAGIQEPITEFSDFITGHVTTFTNAMSDKVMSIFNSITEMIPESIKDFGGKVAGFFGFGDDDTPAKPKASETLTNLKLAETSKAENAVDLAKEKNTKNDRFDSSVAPQRNKGVSTDVDTKDTVSLSKARMDEKSRASQAQTQPIVIQQPAPAPKKSISRELSIGDTELAMMNANMLDG